MTILDRYLLRSLAINYVIALSIMMSLYIVLDLFFNMDEFTERGESAGVVLVNIASYYGPSLFRYFSQLSGVITLVACAATVARLRGSNELTAMLASGVSLYRVAAPVVAFGLLTTTLWVANTEILIPSVADKLARRHEDARGDMTYGVWFLEDRDGRLLSAQEFHPRTETMRRMLVIQRDNNGIFKSAIEADSAVWEPIAGHPIGGRWKLTRGLERLRQTAAADTIGPTDELTLREINYYDSDLTPARVQMMQSGQWVHFLSSRQLSQLAAREIPAGVAATIRQARNARFAAPIVNLVLLLLGIPFLLDRDPGTIITDIAKCLALCGLCFAVAFVGQSLLSADSYSALPSWLPIIVFTPVAVVLIDRIRT